MKLLKIEDKLGYFLDLKDEYTSVDKITKEDLLRLVDLTLYDDVEFDEYSEENINNQAHQIIYKSILQKLQDLIERKQEFIDESERLYLQHYEKYRDELSRQTDAPDKK